MKNQPSFCRHVESAAPIPVPVHIRIPRRYSFDVFDTPANCDFWGVRHDRVHSKGLMVYFDFPGPHGFRWVANKSFRKIAYRNVVPRLGTKGVKRRERPKTLHSADHIVILSVSPLAMRSESSTDR